MVEMADIADNLAKTELIRRLNQLQKANPEMEQRQATSTVRQKTSADAERTHESMKSDLLIITGDKKEQEEKRKGRRREKKLAKNGDGDPDQDEDRHLDVTA
jgi:hypothetical protein